MNAREVQDVAKEMLDLAKERGCRVAIVTILAKDGAAARFYVGYMLDETSSLPELEGLAHNTLDTVKKAVRDTTNPLVVDRPLITQ